MNHKPWRVNKRTEASYQIECEHGTQQIEVIANALIKVQAERIVACVNACEGMPTRSIEEMPDNFLSLASYAHEQNRKLAEILTAAQAVVDRWDSPKWKDQPHTGEYIHALRQAIAKCQPTVQEIK